MPNRGPAPAQYTVRVDGELASFLRSLPNMSEFIRHAVLKQSGRLCPLCLGTGAVPCGIGEHFAEPAERARAAATGPECEAEGAPSSAAEVPGDRDEPDLAATGVGDAPQPA